MQCMVGLPVNASGEIVSSAGDGGDVLSGVVPPDFFPIDSLGRLVVTPYSAYYLDAQSRESSISIPTTPTTYKWSTRVTGSGTDYDTATGILTLPFTGMFSFCFSYNVSATSGTRKLMSAVEVFNGTSWLKSEYSARQQPVKSTETTQVMFVSTNKFTKGLQIRFVTWCDANVNLTTEAAVNSTGYTVPAARILVTGIRSL